MKDMVVLGDETLTSSFPMASHWRKTFFIFLIFIRFDTFITFLYLKFLQFRL
jgi:hypothetical protein